MNMDELLHYVKIDDTNIEETLNLLEIQDIQYYNPIYKEFFELSDNNANTIRLNHKYNIDRLLQKEGYNIYQGTVSTTDKQSKSLPIFFKFSPILDPTKYMMGKLSKEELDIPKYIKEDNISRIYRYHNTAYTEGLFYFLSSQLLHKHNFIHGIDFYGSYLGYKKQLKINMEEDLSLLYNSDFFQKNKDTTFNIIGNIDDFIEYQNDTRKYKDKLLISQTASLKSDVSMESLNNDKLNELFVATESLDKEVNELNELNLLEHTIQELHSDKKTLSTSKCSSESECSSTSSKTNEDDTNSEESNTNDSELEYNSDESGDTINTSDELHVEIDKFPVNIIAIEQCTQTFDKLLTSSEFNLSNAEIVSALMQVIMILITYQKCFNLTHNDLHTNNVMYISTEKENIVYHYNNKYYKVPTFGRLYKIIDFGRGIFNVNNKAFYSDAFSKDGDASNQYNEMPFYNPEKPIISPNVSFDLCRLACSMFDIVIDDEKNDQELNDPVCKLIHEWCLDDKGRNVLYKSNGEERYPGFKLYKMIVRTVTKHVPSKQLEKDIFDAYRVSKNKLNKKTKIINIDKIPCYYQL